MHKSTICETRGYPHGGGYLKARRDCARQDHRMSPVQLSREPYAATAAGLVWKVTWSDSDALYGLEFPRVRVADARSRTLWDRLARLGKAPADQSVRFASVRLLPAAGGEQFSPVLMRPPGRQRLIAKSDLEDWGRQIEDRLAEVALSWSCFSSASLVEPRSGSATLMLSPFSIDQPGWLKITPDLLGEPLAPHPARAATDSLGRGQDHALRVPGEHAANKVIDGSDVLGDQIDASEADVVTAPTPTLRGRASRMGAAYKRRASLKSRRRPKARRWALGIVSLLCLLSLPALAELHQAVLPPAEVSARTSPTTQRPALSACPSLEETAEEVRRLLQARAEAMARSDLAGLSRVQSWDLTLVDAVDLARRAESGQAFRAPQYKVETNAQQCQTNGQALDRTVNVTVGGINSGSGRLQTVALRMRLRGDPPKIRFVESLRAPATEE